METLVLNKKLLYLSRINVKKYLNVLNAQMIETVGFHAFKRLYDDFLAKVSWFFDFSPSNYLINPVWACPTVF